MPIVMVTLGVNWVPRYLLRHYSGVSGLSLETNIPISGLSEATAPAKCGALSSLPGLMELVEGREFAPPHAHWPQAWDNRSPDPRPGLELMP